MVDKVKNLIYKKNTDLLFILALATFVRVKDIIKYEMWFDEAYTGILTKLPIDKFLLEINKDAHPPLYNYLNRYIAQIIGTSDFTMRLLPLICGVLIVYYVYKATEHLFTKQAGVIAGLLIAISPFLIEYSIEARSYSFYALLTIFSFYCVLKDKYFYFFFGLSLLMLTHYFSIFYVFTLGIIFLYRVHSKKLRLLKEKSILYGALVTTITGAYIVFKALNRTYTGLNTSWIRPANFMNVFESIKAYLIGVKSKQPGTDMLNGITLGNYTQLILTAISVVILLGILYLIIKQKSDKKSMEHIVFCLTLWLVPPILITILGLISGKSLYVERYMLPSSIFFFMLIAQLLESFNKFEVTAFVLFLYVLLIIRIQPPDYYDGMKIIAKEFADYQRQIVFTSPMEYTIALYYFYLQDADVSKLKIEDPKAPGSTYYEWPFIYSDLKPKVEPSVIYISSNPSRMTNEYEESSEKTPNQDYLLYIKR